MYASLLKSCPLVIGVLLVIAGIAKLFSPGVAIYGLEAVGVPEALATPGVVGLTVIELYLGIVLLLGWSTRIYLPAVIVMFLGFTAYLWYLSTLASPPGCGCLGLSEVFSSTKDQALFGMIRNTFLIGYMSASYSHLFPNVSDARCTG